MGIKTTFTKSLPLCVFELLTYLNAKTYAKLPLWRKRITLSKNKYFVFFFSILRRKIEKKNAFKEPYMGKRKDFTINMYIKTVKKKKHGAYPVSE